MQVRPVLQTDVPKSHHSSNSSISSHAQLEYWAFVISNSENKKSHTKSLPSHSLFANSTVGTHCFQSISWCKTYLSISLVIHTGEKLLQQDFVPTGGRVGKKVLYLILHRKLCHQPRLLRVCETQPVHSSSSWISGFDLHFDHQRERQGCRYFLPGENWNVFMRDVKRQGIPQTSL